jgi:hypothetical protein
MRGMKFTIRDLLLATVIAALIAGWWLDRSRLARQPPPAPAAVDAFQLLMGGERHNELFLLNPRTGEVWKRAGDASYGQSHWRPHTSTFREK